jgi:hypothetical protein
VHSKCWDAVTQWHCGYLKHCKRGCVECISLPCMNPFESGTVNLCWTHLISIPLQYCYPMLNPFHCHVLTLWSPVLLSHVEPISLSCINPFKSNTSTPCEPSSVLCFNPLQSCAFIHVNSLVTEIFAGNVRCHFFATGMSLECCICTHTVQRTSNFGDMLLAHKLDSPLT